MKKTFLLIFLSCLAFFLKSQSFFEKHPLYIGVDWGFTGNSSSNKINISPGNILLKSESPYPVSPEQRFTANIGYAKEKYSIELSYQILKNTIQYEYGYLRKDAQPIYQSGWSPNEEYLHYLALRYYKNLSIKNKKWQINIGGGIGFAKFDDLFVRPDSSNLGGNSGSRTFFEDSTNFNIEYQAQEQLYRSSTLCFEANLRFQRPIGKYLVFQFWTRAILSPWYMRGEEFQVKRSDRKDPPQTGSAKTTMNSFGFGIGLQYKFSNYFMPKKKAEEGYVDNTESFKPNDGIYTSLSICTTNPKPTEFPALNRNFFGGTSPGDDQGTDFHFLVGYQKGKHSFETGIGTQTSSIGGIFDPKGTFADYENVIGFSSQLPLVVVPLRYYYELIRLRHWHLKVGGGLLNCFVPEPDFLNGVSGIGKEEKLKSYVLTGDISAKIGYSINKHWGINIIGNYGLFAPNIRRLDFDKTNPITPLYVTAKAYNVGLNLQYNF
jgi:hypothetical protein